MLTSPNLIHPNIVHGFFTRKGGVSNGIYDSLNCGFGSGDDQGKVAKNRAVVTQMLGQKPEALCTAYQIHSAKVAVLEKPWHWPEAPEVDALVTTKPGIALGILTADCLPVLFADPKAGVIGAAHAGWKGAIGGVMEATLKAMTQLGAAVDNIYAAIGPAIAQTSYEVGPEFRDTFLAESQKNDVYFVTSANSGRFLFDLPAYAAARLRRTGILQLNMLPQDTCLQESDFFSYRRSCLRNEPAYGRQVSVIALQK